MKHLYLWLYNSYISEGLCKEVFELLIQTIHSNTLERNSSLPHNVHTISKQYSR